MKKLFILFAVASVGFVACNNSAENSTTDDTVAVEPVTVDTNTVIAPADTMVNLDTNSTTMSNDSVGK